MKLTNSVQKKEQSITIAQFSKLLGSEIVLSNYTGISYENAKKDDLVEMASLFSAQHSELIAISNVIAGLAISELEYSEGGIEEFVSGANYLENEANFINSPNMAMALVQAHKNIISIIENEILSVAFETEIDNEVNTAAVNVLHQHQSMIAALESFV